MIRGQVVKTTERVKGMKIEKLRIVVLRMQSLKEVASFIVYFEILPDFLLLLRLLLFLGPRVVAFTTQLPLPQCKLLKSVAN